MTDYVNLKLNKIFLRRMNFIKNVISEMIIFDRT